MRLGQEHLSKDGDLTPNLTFVKMVVRSNDLPFVKMAAVMCFREKPHFQSCSWNFKQIQITKATSRLYRKNIHLK